MSDPVCAPAAGPTRRAVVVGAGAAAVGAGLLAAGCASTAPAPAVDDADPDPEPAASRPGPLGPTSDVPVGGATIYADRGVVVTQAEQGSYVGLSTTCPHQGCAVASVVDATIVCPCHRSTFALDGSVISGPAPRGLQRREITVQGDQIVLV